MGWTCIALVILELLSARAMMAQNQSASKASSKKTSSTESVAHGRELFGLKCVVCHNADSDVKKVGPGLKGISKRGTFSVNNSKITDQSLKTWIENGDNLMPPFKDVLSPDEIKDIVNYVKTL